MSSSSITAQVKSRFSSIFDEKVGLINKILEAPCIITVPLYTYVASAQSGNLIHHTGSAGSRNQDSALSKSIGECLERYASSYRGKPFIWSRYSATNNRYPCLSPKQVEIYHLDELKKISFQLYDEECETLFSIAYNVTRRSYQYVPLPMIYLSSPLFDQYPKQLNIIQQTISTGAAFGVDFYETALAAAYEVIERDAMMACWLLGQELLKIELEGLREEERQLVEQIENNGLQLSLYDISLYEGVFVILATLRSDHPKMPAIAFSAAASHQLDAAIGKALEELLGTFCLAESLLRQERNGYERFLDREKWAAEIVERNDHVKFWSYRLLFDRFAPEIDFILNSSRNRSREELLKRERNYPDHRSAFFSLVEIVAEQGHDLLLFDLSTPEIQSLDGMVLKAIIPGYLPLYLGHRFIYTEARRMATIAESLYGLKKEEIPLNYTPHPFP